ncbi:MAG: ribonuclease E activity regulator RraA [Burkholderiales bacterium]|nr:ribonuclease E activity regulator RraA [Burkholderiales bacterium]
MNFNCCDLCDANEDKMQSGELAILPPVFSCYGKNIQFAGPAKTVKVFEDNPLVRKILETPGGGQVLVIDAGGSTRCALVGGNLGDLAQKNGWAGIVIDGCIRDSIEVNQCNIGVRALGTHPRRSARTGEGQQDGVVTIAGVMVRPGDWIYADADGLASIQ